MLVIDIGLPRNVEHDCSYIPNFHLYDIDDLAGVVSANSLERQQIVLELEDTIESEVRNFSSGRNSWVSFLLFVLCVKSARYARSYHD